MIGAPTRLRGAVLGAWNPGSRWQSEYRNRKRDQRLLRKLGGQYYQSMWGGTDAWWERHFWVPGLTFQRANRLASAMEQKAFLFLNGKHVLLIWCYT
ncbi:DUF3293 domain-containing protein [Acidithiobacillus sp. CV18-2]|nr:DUF3293 domain-containing protein [Acidithiobacillus sp. CV18-3]MBU2757329.1 DUF3293 domain-containing protein [Acidithiobacillus sp. BN09-2]MBU2776092.1 DUF3293 domain-containing protein [Acidithiobacillus sp. CV18-2]MBU2800231.1 DUF3293 domain-containing protein [Acidithiobacillus sp. VAN18-4]UTV82303.1 DUF3293 domain-containing protein [Acidithiobacillus sp. YTS05]